MRLSTSWFFDTWFTTLYVQIKFFIKTIFRRRASRTTSSPSAKQPLESAHLLTGATKYATERPDYMPIAGLPRLAIVGHCSSAHLAVVMLSAPLAWNGNVELFSRHGHPSCKDFRPCRSGLGDMNDVWSKLITPAGMKDYRRFPLNEHDQLSFKDIG